MADVDCNGLAEGPDRFMLVSSLSWIRPRGTQHKELTDVDTARPPITATARGRWISAPEPKPKARAQVRRNQGRPFCRHIVSCRRPLTDHTQSQEQLGLFQPVFTASSWRSGG